jgi:eukaryotic-like serine/threonine-protein kinase
VRVLLTAISAALLVLPAGALSADAVAPGAWPVFHANVTHTGVAATEHVLKPSNVGRLRVLWQRKVSKALGGIVNSSVAVGSSAVYIGNGDGYLYSFRRPGGALRWRAKTGRSIQSSPAIANGVVYVGSVSGSLYAYKTGCASGGKTCEPLYRGPPTGGQPFAASPAVVAGKVYYGAFTSVRAFALRG